MLDIVHINLEERISMPGGTQRSTTPRDLAADPDAWPHSIMIGHHQARVVQALARNLGERLEERGLSLRQAATLTGVNRQAIVNLLSGISWPDVVTVSLLEDGLGVALWPGAMSPASAEC
ncbi:helix-turn-helix transcriptional regulator [Streptomyces sp. KAI-26]|uniref:helix-turn-helix domain-containing protein n=1 Tax=Streptomyces sp. KAI-26 TaxID=1169747 RepID=UPI001587D208|nr:helix-turn-helix transcriptional regulator [Streptomyces sp. KAI-26]NUV87790.1 helix-turn-helix transcriptional regulator [Streptomyces sp. KAI-26]NUW20278.1 helix-turn-helix transcriptional regulator [Streptomyces roseoviolaceus]